MKIIKKLFVGIFIIGAIIGGGYLALNYADTKGEITPVAATADDEESSKQIEVEQETVDPKHIESIKKRPEFQQMVELEAKEIALSELRDEYITKIDELETELAAIREEKSLMESSETASL